MARTRKLTVEIAGDARGARRAFGEVERSSEGLGRKLAGFAKVAALGLGAAAAGFAAKSLVAFAGFEKGMNEVFTLLPGISQEAMDKMSGQVKKFSTDFGVLPEKTIPALYQALSAGVPQDNVFAFLETAQKAAKGGVTELETAVDGISSVVNAYGSEVIDATKASDLMFTAVRLGKTNFEELSASLFNVTPTAAALGVNFGDVTAALAAMTAKGVPTAVATTQLRSLFVELSQATGKASKAFKQVSGKTFKEFIRSGGNVNDALDMMKTAAEKSGVGIQDLFGSVEAGAAALSLQGNPGFTEGLEAMGESAGATQAAFDQMQKGLGPIFDKIKARFAVLSISVGEWLAPRLEAAMNVLSEWWTRNGPTITANIATIKAAVVAFVTDALDVMKTWWDNNGETVLAVINAFKVGVQTAFAAVIEAGEFVHEHWDQFKYLAGVMAVSVAGHYVKLGVAAVTSAATQATAWLSMKAAAIASKAETVAIIALMIADWVKLAVAAALNAARVAAAWVVTQLAAGRAAAMHTAAVATQVGGWSTLAASAQAKSALIAKAWIGALGPAAAVIAAAETINNLTGNKGNPADKSLLERINPFHGLHGIDVGMPDLPIFASGGVMPGPKGVHSLAMVAGGETILPTHDAGFTSSLRQDTRPQVIQLVVSGRVLAEVIADENAVQSRNRAS